MMRMLVTCVFWALAAALAAAYPLAGQTASDTLYLTIAGDMTTVRINVPVGQMRRGDTITFTAAAVNQAGDPVSAIFTWSVEMEPPTAAPALIVDPATGFATAIRRTNQGERVILIVTAQQVDGSVTGWIKYPGQSLQVGVPLTLQIDSLGVGEQASICRYLTRNLFVVAGSPGDPILPCPATPPGYLLQIPTGGGLQQAMKLGTRWPHAKLFTTGD